MQIARRDLLCAAAALSASFTFGLGGTKAETTIRIGFFGPLTEAFAGLGKEAKKGADLAIKQANAAGGIGGRAIELIAYDDRGNRTEAVAVSRQMIEQDKVVAIVDGSLSLT